MLLHFVIAYHLAYSDADRILAMHWLAFPLRGRDVIIPRSPTNTRFVMPNRLRTCVTMLVNAFGSAVLPGKTSLSAGPCGDELIEADVPHGAEHCRDIPMRQASLDLHRASITDERPSAGEPIFDDGEQIVWQV